MSVGPLRRLTGAVGLVALVPTAWLLATNAITLTVAAVRAIVTLAAVVALGRLVGCVVGGLAGSFERDEEEAAPAGEGGLADWPPAEGAPAPQGAQTEGSSRASRRSAAPTGESGGNQPQGLAASR